jgi:hypothetical protein
MQLRRFPPLYREKRRTGGLAVAALEKLCARLHAQQGRSDPIRWLARIGNLEEAGGIEIGTTLIV